MQYLHCNDLYIQKGIVLEKELPLPSADLVPFEICFPKKPQIGLFESNSLFFY